KRVVAPAVARILTQRGRSKQPGASTRAQMAADVIFCAGVRVEYLDPGRVDIPIRKSRFLALARRALLVNLTCNREHFRGPQCTDLAQRRLVERHVIVHQERPVIPNALKPFVDGGTESTRAAMVNPFQL